MFYRFILFTGLIVLASCAYLQDESIQGLEILTPGAEDAVCYVYIDKLRHKVYPPRTFTISKSRHDMTVDCLAPGNRRRKIVIAPRISDHAYENVTNGIVPGMAWDFASDSLYSYPDTISVDFTSAVSSVEQMPAHNNPDIKQPEEYMLEEFRAGLPRLNSDSNNEPTQILRRQKGGSATGGAPVYTESHITEQEGGGKPSDKGDLGNVINNLNGDINPSGAQTTATKPAAPPVQQAPAVVGPPTPVPLYPGQ